MSTKQSLIFSVTNSKIWFRFTICSSWFSRSWIRAIMLNQFYVYHTQTPCSCTHTLRPPHVRGPQHSHLHAYPKQLTFIHTDDNTNSQSDVLVSTLHNHNASVFIYGRKAVPPTSGWLKNGTFCTFYSPSTCNSLPGQCVKHASFKMCCEHCLLGWGVWQESWSVCGSVDVGMR